MSRSSLRWAGTGAVLAGLAVLAGAFGRRFFLAGVVLFSGSLYALALSGVAALGAITPLGGAALLAGWVCFALALFRARPADASTP